MRRISLWRTPGIPWGLREKHDFQPLLRKEPFLPGNEPGKIKTAWLAILVTCCMGLAPFIRYENMPS
jgi:hypothetical protein